MVSVSHALSICRCIDPTQVAPTSGFAGCPAGRRVLSFGASRLAPRIGLQRLGVKWCSPTTVRPARTRRSNLPSELEAPTDSLGGGVRSPPRPSPWRPSRPCPRSRRRAAWMACARPAAGSRASNRTAARLKRAMAAPRSSPDSSQTAISRSRNSAACSRFCERRQSTPKLLSTCDCSTGGSWTRTATGTHQRIPIRAGLTTAR